MILGLAVAVLPGTATVELDPEIVLVVVLPPLLYSAALEASLLDFTANTRPIALLSVGLVAFTALLVGAVAHLSVPGLPWAAALAFGAVVAPPDAVAAIAIGRRVGMPARLQTLIEGEGLLNDATALVLYQVAVAAAVGGSFSVTRSAGLLLLASVGGVAAGLAVAWLVVQVRTRLEEPLIENVLSLATPFLAYLPAERMGASGVLAVVVCGLVLGHRSPTLLSSTSRLQTGPVWRVLVFLLEGAVFLVIGLQLPEILHGLSGYHPGRLALWSAAVVLTVLLSRPAWIWPATYLPRIASRRLRLRDPAPPWQHTAALSWAGMRGVVSLAAAFALPLTTEDGADFPQRDLLLFLVFVVILVTLLVQGLTFGKLLRAFGLRPDRRALLLAQAGAQQVAAEAALRALDSAVADSPDSEPVAARLRALTQARADARWERLAELSTGQPETPSGTWRRLRSVMLSAERETLVRLRAAGQLPEEAMREMQLQLDLEEAGLLALGGDTDRQNREPAVRPDTRLRRSRPEAPCAHLAAVRPPVQPDSLAGCPDCMRAGTTWVHLRECLTCGHVGCCDSSPERHAEAHYRDTDHPVIQSFEPGEQWVWCFPDGLLAAEPATAPALPGTRAYGSQRQV